MNTLTNNYWHFRTNTVEGNEDTSDDSIMIPVASITGILPGYYNSYSNTSVTIHFKKGIPLTVVPASATDLPTQTGMVTIGITIGRQKEVLEFLAQASNTSNNKKSYLTIADDLNSDYAFRHITQCKKIAAA